MRKMINIVVPMAGAGSRFAKAGYELPKPLINVLGKPMIKLVIENLTPKNYETRFIFLCQQEHLEKFDLKEKLELWAPGCEVVPVNGLTEGAACTVLLAKEFINSNSPLVIANCDQYIDCNIDDFLDAWFDGGFDGEVMTMTANDPKWSFVGFDKSGAVERIVEKEVISDEATVGIYAFSKGKDFVRSAENMIQRNERVKNEFYVAPAYNELIKKGAKLGIFNIGSEANGMYGLGIPADLEYFVKLDWVKEICEK